MLSTTDTPAVRAQVERLARTIEIPPHHSPARTEVFFEHGQWWITVDAWSDMYGEGTTATFAVIDTDRGLDCEYVDGFDW
jgi:hypothetical protein